MQDALRARPAQATRSWRFIDRTFPIWAALASSSRSASGSSLGGSYGRARPALLWGGWSASRPAPRHVQRSTRCATSSGRRASRPATTRATSRGSRCSSFGEAWHNNHHAFPTSSVRGLRPLADRPLRDGHPGPREAAGWPGTWCASRPTARACEPRADGLVRAALRGPGAEGRAQAPWDRARRTRCSSTGRSVATQAGDAPLDGPPCPLTRAESEAFASAGPAIDRIEEAPAAANPGLVRRRAEFRK